MTKHFATATELCGREQDGFDASLLIQVGRTLCTALVQSGLGPAVVDEALSNEPTEASDDASFRVMVASEKDVEEHLWRALVDGLLLGGAQVVSFGVQSAAKFELCQAAGKAVAGLYLSTTTTTTTGENSQTFGELIRDEKNENSSQAMHALALYIQQVPQIGERLVAFAGRLNDDTQVSGQSAYREATYEEYVPDDIAEAEIRENMNANTIAEKSIFDA